MGAGKRKQKKPDEYDLEDLLKFERFISGKNGGFTYDELVVLLTYGRLDSLMKESPAERRQLLAANYDAALGDPERLGYVIIEVYDEVFNGDKGRVPNGIYDGHQGKLNFKHMLRYAIAAKMKWKKEDIPSLVSKQKIRSLKLGRGLDVLFQNTPSEAIMFCYPEMDLKEWYFGTNAENVWYQKDENGEVKMQDDKPVIDYKKAATATKEFIESWISQREESEVEDALESEKGTVFEGKRINGRPAILVPKMIAKDFFKPLLPYKANLKHMLKICFGDSPGPAITNAYPTISFKPHYFRSCPDNYWVGKDGTPNMEHILEAAKEFCDLWLDGRPISSLETMRHTDFEEPLFPGGSTAGGLVRTCIKNKAFESYNDLVAAAYPGQFKVMPCKELGRSLTLVYIGKD